MGEPRSSTGTFCGLEFLTALASDLSHGPLELPCFPDVVIKIRDALNNPTVTADESVRLVGTEPLLAARILQVANSASFNVAGKRITELRAAIIRLGQKVVQGVAMAFALNQMRNESSLRSIAKPLSALWRESVLVACLCQVIAKRAKMHPEEAFLAGLMHGIGRLYIMVHAVGKANDLQENVLNETLIAAWHPGIAKAVLENWGTSELISDAVGAQLEYDRELRGPADLTDVLIVAVILAEMLESKATVVDMTGVTSFARLNLNNDECLAMVTHSQHSMASLQDVLGC